MNHTLAPAALARYGILLAAAGGAAFPAVRVAPLRTLTTPGGTSTCAAPGVITDTGFALRSLCSIANGSGNDETSDASVYASNLNMTAGTTVVNGVSYLNAFGEESVTNLTSSVFASYTDQRFVNGLRAAAH